MPGCQRCRKAVFLKMVFGSPPAELLRMDGFPGGSVGKNRLPMQETQVQSPGQEDPLEEEVATRSSVLVWKSMDSGAWRATSPWRPKESNTTEQLNVHKDSRTPGD